MIVSVIAIALFLTMVVINLGYAAVFSVIGPEVCLTQLLSISEFNDSMQLTIDDSSYSSLDAS